MTKFAVLFVAALAFQAIWAAPNQQEQEQLQQQLQRQQGQAQQILNQIQGSSNNVVASIQSLQVYPETYQTRRYLSSQANDYAYDIQSVAHNLQQAIQQYQGYQYQQQVRQIYRRLSEISYLVQQAVNSQPVQLQAVLQNNVENSAAEAQRLVQIVQKSQNYEQNQQQGQQNEQGQQNLSLQEILQDQYYLNYQIVQALYGILGASQRIQAQYQLRNQNQEQIRNQIQSQIAQVSNSVQSVNPDNEEYIQNLSYQAYQLSQNIGYIINRLQRQVNYAQEGEVRNVLQQVSNKLSEIRGALEQAGNYQEGASVQDRIQQLQNRIKVNVNGAAAQIERLLEVVQPNNQTNYQGRRVNYLVNNVLADGLAAVQYLQSQLQGNAQNAQNN